jgi:hypothetical protein
MNVRGRMDRIVSSKSNVKSNPPRQWEDMAGPNVLSAKAHAVEDFDAMITN